MPKRVKMAGDIENLKTRFSLFQISFTIVLCLFPYLFLRYTVYAVLITVVFKLIGLIRRRVTNSRLDSKGRGVLITGCDSGFGFMFAQHFDELGYTVFAGCLNEKGDGARKLRKECSKRLHVVAFDISKDQSVSNALIYVKNNLPRNGLWGVVNNAGINMCGEVELIPVSVYERGFSVNLYGPIRVIREFLFLVRQARGRVVNITSVHGKYSLPGQSNYETAKHAIETLSDSLRLEMKKFGVQVCIVEPGMYAGGTSIDNEAAIKRRTDDILVMWNQASPEVKQSYSKSYMLSWLPSPREKLPSQHVDLSPVITAVDHAICSDTPRARYLVDGEGLIDQYAMLARIHNILPTWIVDKGVAVWRNCYRTPK